MGTFLGNLQVLSANENDVAALMPKGAIVEKWSERFVTVLHESFGFGAMDRPAKKLSKQLPQATVLAVGLVDSDAVELSVWREGKRITAMIGEYEGGPSKKGDPKKFCAALDLPEEDVPRLKAVWAKGDAEEQLNLTAALLGAPLYADPRVVPEKQVVRDTEYVDRWLEERPDPPRVKNRTKAELIQELTGVQPDFPDDWLRLHTEQVRSVFLLHHVDEEGWYLPEEDIFCRSGADGTLVDVERFDCLPEELRDGYSASLLGIGGGRVLALALNHGAVNVSVVVGDSEGQLACPLFFELDGQKQQSQQIRSMEDGGILAWITSPDLKRRALVRYAADGTALWSRVFDDPDGPYSPAALWQDRGYFEINITKPYRDDMPDCWLVKDGEVFLYHFFCIDQEGKWKAEADFGFNSEVCGQDEDGLWITEPVYNRDGGQPQYNLIRVSLDLEEQARVRLPGLQVTETVWNKDKSLVMHTAFREGLWILDGKDLSIRASILDKRWYCAAVADAHGRFWVWLSSSTLEAYDQNLTLLSRHRLKGRPVSRHMDGEGRLCVVTYSEKNHILRVYRLS